MARVVIDARLDARGLNRTLYALDGQTGKIIEARARDVLAAARRLCPVRSGRLVGSIGYRMRTSPKGPTGIISASAPYARYVNDGTGIYGPRGTMIHGRQWFFGEDFGHLISPDMTRGSPATHFLNRALEAAGRG